MSKLRTAFVAAAVFGLALATFDPSAHAKGGNGTGSAGTGGGAGAGSGGTGGAGAGSNPNLAATALPAIHGHPKPQSPQPIENRFSASCAKQEPVFNRYGFIVGYAHGADCWQ